MSKQKLIDVLMLTMFGAAILFAVAVMTPGLFDQRVSLARNIPWATWRI